MLQCIIVRGRIAHVDNATLCCSALSNGFATAGTVACLPGPWCIAPFKAGGGGKFQTACAPRNAQSRTRALINLHVDLKLIFHVGIEPAHRGAATRGWVGFDRRAPDECGPNLVLDNRPPQCDNRPTVNDQASDLDAMLDEARAVTTVAPAVAQRVSQAPRLRYSHDALIDLVIAHPEATQNWLAGQFGYTPSWVSTIMTSDSWLARLADRRKELIDPALVATIEHKFKAASDRALNVVLEKLSRPTDEIPDQLALQALQIASRAAGFGAREVQPPVSPVSVHVHLESMKENLVGLLRRERGVIEHSPPSDPAVSLSSETISPK